MEKQTGRYLGVDYGDVRTGIAVSDPTGFLASGLETIRPGGMRRTARAVAEIARKQEAVGIVVGMPLNMDGSAGGRVSTVEAFIGLLQAETDLPIIRVDERLSTVEAHGFLSAGQVSSKRRRQVIDTLSAEIILQDFLDERRKKST